MEYNNRVICGIFHVRTNFYENLEYVLGNLTSPLKAQILTGLYWDYICSIGNVN